MTGEPHVPQALLQRLCDGDREALAELFAYYQPRLRQMVRLRWDARLGQRVDPSDVLQDTYLDAARQIDGYLRQPRVAFYIWLRGLVRERLANLRRQHLGARCRAAGREAPLPAASSMLLAQQLLAPGSRPSQALLKAEVRQQVQRALARLATADREVLLMRHFEGLSNGEVAQALGLTDSAATMRYGRALLRLKESLKVELNSEERQP
jgi:RNA polymerase sigma-70 factor (ECF subfamily)